MALLLQLTNFRNCKTFYRDEVFSYHGEIFHFSVHLVHVSLTLQKCSTHLNYMNLVYVLIQIGNLNKQIFSKQNIYEHNCCEFKVMLVT